MLTQAARAPGGRWTFCDRAIRRQTTGGAACILDGEHLRSLRNALGRLEPRLGGENKMVRIQGDIIINRPPEQVFDLVADERNEPRFNPRMRRAELITQGPIGVGSRFRAEVASAGRPIEMVVEYTGFERPRRLTSTTRMASMVVGYTLTFEPIAGGTWMRWVGDLEPRGILRLLGPLVAWMGWRQERRIWAGLKHLLEARGAPLSA